MWRVFLHISKNAGCFMIENPGDENPVSLKTNPAQISLGGAVGRKMTITGGN